MKSDFLKGMSNGIPIMLGYFSVSFGFGVLAVKMGLSVLAAFSISATNLTSAGQVAGLSVITAGGSLLEMAICQLVINLRYALMGISLSQRLDKSMNLRQRLMISFGITDEIFAVASTKKETLTAKYMYGLILTPFIGWVGGTLLGAVASGLMPELLSNAMGIMLYGMFVAIIIPPSKKSRSVLMVVIFAAALSIICKYFLPFISDGFAVILCAIISSAVCAAIFPVKEEESQS